MPALTLYEEVEDVLTNRMKNASQTGETISAPEWVTDLVRCVALAVVMVDEKELPQLTKFAHEQLDRLIHEEWAARVADDRSPN
jgi:hypothetical protein